MSMTQVNREPDTLSRSYYMEWGSSITFPTSRSGLILVNGTALYAWWHPGGNLTVNTISGKSQPTLTEGGGNITVSLGWEGNITVWCSPR